MVLSYSVVLNVNRYGPFQFNRLAPGCSTVIHTSDQVGDLPFLDQQLWPFPPYTMQCLTIIKPDVMVVNDNGIKLLPVIHAIFRVQIHSPAFMSAHLSHIVLSDEVVPPTGPVQVKILELAIGPYIVVHDPVGSFVMMGFRHVYPQRGIAEEKEHPVLFDQDGRIV